MKPVSLADITFEQGLQLLSLRKQGLDSGIIRRMPKEAMDNAYPLQAVGTQTIEAVKAADYLEDFKNSVSDGLSSAGNDLQASFDGVKGGVQNWWGNLEGPTKSTLKHGLIGAGLGAASGAGASFTGDGRHYGRNMLMGGIAGGAIGGGLGLVRNPEIADSLQARIAEFAETEKDDSKRSLKATQAAAPAPDPSISSRLGLPQAEPKKSPEQLTKETARVAKLPIEGQVAEVEKNREILAGSPNRDAVFQGAGVTGGTAYGIHKLHGIDGYDPRTLAETLKRMQTAPGSGLPVMQSRAIRAELGTTPEVLQRKTVAEIEKLIRSKKQLGVHLNGSPKNPNAVASLLGVPAGSPLPGATSKGFRGGLRRPFRGAGLIGLLAAGGYGLAHTEMGRRAAVASQENARSLLGALQSIVMKDK